MTETERNIAKNTAATTDKLTLSIFSVRHLSRIPLQHHSSLPPRFRAVHEAVDNTERMRRPIRIDRKALRRKLRLCNLGRGRPRRQSSADLAQTAPTGETPGLHSLGGSRTLNVARVRKSPTEEPCAFPRLRRTKPWDASAPFRLDLLKARTSSYSPRGNDTDLPKTASRKPAHST